MKYIVVAMTPFALIAFLLANTVALYRVSLYRSVVWDGELWIIGGCVAYLIAYVLVFALFIALEVKKRRAASQRERALFNRDASPIWSRTAQDATIDWRIGGLLLVALVAVIAVVAGVRMSDTMP